RHRPKPVAGGRPARHPHCRGRECPADRAVAAPRQGSARRLRLFRLLRLHRRGRVGNARLVREALSDLPRHRVPRSKIHRYSLLSDEEAIATATAIWERTNFANLEENILPTRPRATLILTKGADHVIETVALRRL